MRKLLNLVVVAMAVLLVGVPPALAEDYTIPGRAFSGYSQSVAHSVYWPDAYPSIGYGGASWVWASVPHHRTTNGLTVTVNGRYNAVPATAYPCTVYAMSRTGTATSVQGTTPPRAVGAWTSVVSLTQAQVDSYPFMVIMCGVPYNTYIYGATVTFGWTLGGV